MFDLCVVGHVTRDIIRIDNTREELPGGVAYYCSMACKSLGGKVAVVTKCAGADRDLLRDLIDLDIRIVHGRSDQTTTFEHTYRKDLDGRTEKVTGLAAPFTLRDIPDIPARLMHLGPLTRWDISMDVLRSLSQKTQISLDVQGFVRHVESGRVRCADWEEKEEGLSYVTILKASETEARLLSGQTDVEQAAVRLSAHGIREIVITRGSMGSLIYAEGKMVAMPSFVPKTIVNPTGCGDTYIAGYIFRRLQGCGIEESGKFAAAVAALKLETHGPFRGTETDVENFLTASGR